MDISNTSAARSCGACTLCCRLPEISAFSKEANEWCSHCIPERGCAIYAERPSLCREFLCLWLTEPDLAADFDPIVSNMMIYRQGPQITVLVDPDVPDTWKREPYQSQLRQWATAVEPEGGYIIVFAGDEVHKVEPEKL